MAGDWIKMRVDLFTHPKVVRIASALKADNLRTVGGLMSVWCLFDAHSIDGRIDGYTTETLDDMLRWPGFAAQMVAVSWLEQDGEVLVLPEFDSHNGASAKRRAQDADRKKNVRKMSASQADEMRTREEKRREENTKRQKEQQLVQPAAARSRFDDFWDVYPNKKGKESARKTWQRRRLDMVASELVAHVGLMLERDDSWRRGFIPMGSTYLNQARWEDEPTGPPVDRPVNGNASAPSKTLTAIQKLQAMKNGQVDSERDHGRVEQAALPGT